MVAAYSRCKQQEALAVSTCNEVLRSAPATETVTLLLQMTPKQGPCIGQPQEIISCQADQWQGIRATERSWTQNLLDEAAQPESLLQDGGEQRKQ